MENENADTALTPPNGNGMPNTGRGGSGDASGFGKEVRRGVGVTRTSSIRAFETVVAGNFPFLAEAVQPKRKAASDWKLQKRSQLYTEPTMLLGRAFVRQNDQSDCGAAALATVALHYRMPVGVQRLRDLAGTDRVGTNLRGLVDAAEKLGFSAKAVKGPYEALPEVPLPAIAHVVTEDGVGHFVVLYRVKRNSVVIADPAKGVERLSREAFCKRWTGYLLILQPDAMRSTNASGAGPKSPWVRFLMLLACHKNTLLEGFVCALLMTLLGIGTSYFIQHLVDSVLARGERQLLNALGLGMVLIVIFRTLFGVVRQYVLAHVGRKVDLSLIASYARHILRLPTQFFEMRQVGEILSRVNDAANVREAISGTALTAMVDAMMVILSFSVLWFYDARLALVSTAFVPLLVISVMAHHRPVKRKSRETMENAARLSAHLVEDISGVDTIKAFGLEQTRTEEAESRLWRVVQSGFSLQKLGISMGTAGAFVTGIAGIVILWYGGHRVMAGALTIGELMFFSTLLGYLLQPLQSLTSVNVQLQEALVAIDRLYQVMDLDTEQPGDRANAEFTGPSRGIQLDNVCFRYGCRDHVLKKVSLAIPAGKTVAIVGESGSGKSTLLKLLMRFYDPTDGRILVDGQDYRDFDVHSVRQRVGLVAQEPFIFNGTVQENIALGCSRATMNEVIDAARAAGLDEFINSLPDRFDTVIGERGANLSGGQRQRLAIARALLRKPEILIFDEATSHLDTATELAIQQSMRTALADKTVLLVAHRLSTIKDADLIYVLHDGQMVEQGTHRELLSQEGTYAGLWRAQTEGLRPAQRVNGKKHPRFEKSELATAE
jgi:ATP-binding cassette subfamily B protein